MTFETTRRDFLKKAMALSAGLMWMSPSARVFSKEAEIRIGTLCPLTGAGSPYGPTMQRAMEWVVEEANSVGGPLGRKIKLYSEDSETDPDAAVRAAKKLIEVNEVVAVLGSWSGPVTLAIAPLAIRSGVISMSTSGDPSLTTLDDNDFVWRTQPTVTMTGKAFAHVAGLKKYKKAAILAYNNEALVGLARSFRETFRASGGEIVSDITYAPDLTSYRSELRQTLNASPDVVVLSSYTPDATLIMREAYQMGANVHWMGPGWAINEELARQVPTPFLEGSMVVDSYPNVESPAYERLNSKFLSEFGSDIPSNPYAAQALDQMVLVSLAIESAGSDVPSRFKPHLRAASKAPGNFVHAVSEGINELRRGNQIDYDGISSRINFDEFGDIAPNYAFFELHNGARKLETVFHLEA